MSSIVKKDYPQTETDISLARTGCTTNLQLYPQGSSGSRVVMQGIHYTQVVQIDEAEPRNIFAGPERDYANYMHNVTVPHDCSVIRVIDRYAKPGRSNNRILETLVFVEVHEHGVTGDTNTFIDVISIPNHIQNHQTFAVELVRTEEARRLGAGKYLRKGTVLAQAKSVVDGEYCAGLNVNTLLVSHPLVIEDACVVSESLAERMGSWGYKTYRMTVGEKDFPLLLYKNKDGTPAIFPEIGAKVRRDGILFAKREYDPLLSAVELSAKGLRRVCGHNDDCTFVPAGSEVIDVKVHRDDLRIRRRDPETGENLPCEKMATPAGIQELCDTYSDGLSIFQGHIRSFYKECMKSKKRGYNNFSPEVKQLLDYAIADDPSDLNRGLFRYAKQFGAVKCDDYMIEVTIRHRIPLSVSGKITDTMGGKGIVGMVLPDDQMPYNEDGVRVDLMMSDKAMLRRTNFNRGFECEVGASRRDVTKHIKELVEDNKYQEAYEYLVRFTHAVNPEWAEAIEATHTTPSQQDELVENIASGNDRLRLFVPSDNKYTMDQVLRNIKADFPAKKSRLTITDPRGRKVLTQGEFSIGELYIVRLDKWGGEFSAIGAGRFQSFGTIAKQHSSDKHKRPIRENPITHQGETEGRHQQAFIGGDVCADNMDRSNNPAVADNIVWSILSAEVPSNIEHAVDRRKYPLGHNRAMEINRHILRCNGIRFTSKQS